MSGHSHFSSIKHKKGFTVIELLVVIAIFGLLTSIVFGHLKKSKAIARDGERKAEMDSLRKALAIYYETEGEYPKQETGWTCIEDTVGQAGKVAEEIKTHLSDIPEDPLYPKEYNPDEKYCYNYKTENDGQDYKIHVKMETGTDGYQETYSGGGGGIAYQGPETNLSECKVLDIEGAEYFVTADITNTESLDCLDITANNITLDCQGYTIATGNGNGIHIERASAEDTNITVKNCTIVDGRDGIHLYNANNNTIDNITLKNISSGVFLESSNYNNLSNLDIEPYDYGLNLRVSNYNNISDITISGETYDGDTGIYLRNYSSHNTINNGRIKNFKGTWLLKDGIYVSTYSNFNILSNLIIEDNDIGFRLASASNILTNSIIRNNIKWGTWLDFMGSGGPNQIYNNLFINELNVDSSYSNIFTNYWSTDRQLGTRIYSEGPEIGGNYWSNPSGTGYSDTCPDADTDGFCDNSLDLSGDGKNIDLLPLSNKYQD